MSVKEDNKVDLTKSDQEGIKSEKLGESGPTN